MASIVESIFAGKPLVITVFCMCASYLLCGIPFGLVIGRILGQGDIRRAGSGNIGTTNALRVAGPKVAALTLLFDVVKGALCTYFGRNFIALVGYGFNVVCVDPGTQADWMVALVALACLYGHIFSPYLKFHGGKGIATGVGILLGFHWQLGLFHLGVFIVLVALSKYVSLGSVVTAFILPFTIRFTFPLLTIPAWVIWTVLAWTVVWAHRGNIKRLLQGKESKLSFSKRVNTMDGE